MDLNRIDDLMEQAVSDGIFPGGVLLFFVNDNILYEKPFGTANLFTGRPVTKHTLFDLASLTKPLATTLCIMSLVSEGILRLDTKLKDVPDFQVGSEKAEVSIADLLLHRSGLPSWRPFYMELEKSPISLRKALLKELLDAERLENPPGKKTLYSDLGFMFLHLVIEAATRQPLDEYLEKRVYSPMGLANILYLDSGKIKPTALSFAATEYCRSKGRVLEGEVHDENARALGGVAGHAGLFATAFDVAKLLMALLSGYSGKKEPIGYDPDLIRTFLSRPSADMRTYGFDVPDGKSSSSGSCFSIKSVGHLGFTGTSFWLDLEKGAGVVLLTNRVHPKRTNNKIKQFRPLIHDVILEELDLCN